jgi:hypothetical protein
MSLLLALLAGSGGTTYTINPSGSIVFSGSNILAREKAFSPGGLVLFTGTASLSTGGGNTFTLNPSGLIVYSGNNKFSLEHVQIPSGQFTFSGTSTEIKNRSFTPSGLITYTGIVSLGRTHINAPIGGTVQFSSTAPINFTAGGAGVSTNYISRLNNNISKVMGL